MIPMCRLVFTTDDSSVDNRPMHTPASNSLNEHIGDFALIKMTTYERYDIGLRLKIPIGVWKVLVTRGTLVVVPPAYAMRKRAMPRLVMKIRSSRRSGSWARSHAAVARSSRTSSRADGEAL